MKSQTGGMSAARNGKGCHCPGKTAGGNGDSRGRAQQLVSSKLEECLVISKALSDENRLRVLMFLGDGELCVCQIIEMLDLAPSTISQHMAVLHRAGLVEARKEGRWIFYRLADQGTSEIARTALQWVRSSLEDDPQIRDDAKRLRAVKRTPVKDLCRCYKA